MAKEIGPSLDLVYRRSEFANDEDFKKACKQPKVKKDKSVFLFYFGGVTNLPIGKEH